MLKKKILSLIRAPRNPLMIFDSDARYGWMRCESWQLPDLGEVGAATKEKEVMCDGNSGTLESYRLRVYLWLHHLLAIGLWISIPKFLFPHV